MATAQKFEIRYRRCYQCKAILWPTDDADICIEHGGRSARIFKPPYCRDCGTRIGFLGVWLEKLLGKLHACSDA